MDELLKMFLAGQRTFGAHVHAVSEQQWGAATPDSEWSVADLVRHVLDEQRWLPPLMHGLSLAAAEEVVAGTRELPVHGGVGANLAESWDEAAAAAEDAAVEPGALGRSVELSRGATPAKQYLTEMTFDLAVHSWDLGKAIGARELLPEELAGFVLEQVRGMGDLSGSGMFGKPVDVPADASVQDKLVAATGRDPGWSRS